MEARYYGRLVQVAGRVRGAYLDGVRCTLSSRTIGTKDDELLRVLSGTPGKKLSIHVCSESCAGALTDPLLIHGRAWLKLI